MDWYQVKNTAARLGVLYMRETLPDTDYGNAVVCSPLDRSLVRTNLYFCTLSTLRELLSKQNADTAEQLSFVVNADIPFSPAQLDFGQLGNVLVVEQNEDVAALYMELLSLLDAERDIEYNFRQLVLMNRRNYSLPQLAEKISQVYHGAPVLFISNTFSVLAASCEGEYTSYREELCQISSDPAGKCSQISMPEPHEAIHTMLLHVPELPLIGYRTKVYLHAVVIGYLDVFSERGNALSALDILYLNHIADLLGHRFPSENAYLRESAGLAAHLLSALLSGEVISHQEVQMRMQRFGYRLKDCISVAVLTSDTARLTEAGLSLLGQGIRSIFENAIFTVQGLSLIFLISSDEEYEVTAERMQRWQMAAQSNELHMGLSTAFRNIGQLQEKLQEAQAALQTGGNFYPEQRVFSYESLRSHHLARTLQKHCSETVSMLLYPPVQKLLQYDQEHDAQLTYTLYLLLQMPKEPLEVCRKLHIHKNTLYARLRKIRGFLRENPECVEVATKIYLTLLLLSGQGKLYFRIEPDQPLAEIT